MNHDERLLEQLKVLDELEAENPARARNRRRVLLDQARVEAQVLAVQNLGLDDAELDEACRDVIRESASCVPSSPGCRLIVKSVVIRHEKNGAGRPSRPAG